MEMERPSDDERGTFNETTLWLFTLGLFGITSLPIDGRSLGGGRR